MNLDTDPLESRLDALGRAMAMHSATPPPAGFLVAVGRRRQMIVIRRIGLVAAAGAAITLLILLANFKQHTPPAPKPATPAVEKDNTVSEVTPPTFGAMRTIAAVDAGPQMRVSAASMEPVVRAGDSADEEAVRRLVMFK